MLIVVFSNYAGCRQVLRFTGLALEMKVSGIMIIIPDV